MQRIGNNSGKYVKRSSLVTRPNDGEKLAQLRPSAEREREFMTAPIDDSFYMKFRSISGRSRTKS